MCKIVKLEENYLSSITRKATTKLKSSGYVLHGSKWEIPLHVSSNSASKNQKLTMMLYFRFYRFLNIPNLVFEC